MFYVYYHKFDCTMFPTLFQWATNRATNYHYYTNCASVPTTSASCGVAFKIAKIHDCSISFQRSSVFHISPFSFLNEKYCGFDYKFFFKKKEEKKRVQGFHFFIIMGLFLPHKERGYFFQAYSTNTWAFGS